MTDKSPLDLDRQRGVAAVAKAFATYAMVPYLGILFCPGAVIVGGLGILKGNGSTQRSDLRVCYFSLVAGLIIGVIQIVLWWLLYRVPEWARQ
jgi:hypothetical protein